MGKIASQVSFLQLRAEGKVHVCPPPQDLQGAGSARELTLAVWISRAFLCVCLSWGVS